MTRGDWARCRNELEEAAIVLGMVTKGGPQWAMSLPLSQLYRHCRQAEKIIKRQNAHRGVLVTSNADGDLVFTQAGSQQTDTLELGKNLLDADFSDDWRNRYSEYLVKGHGGGGGHKGEAKAAALLAAPKGATDDKAVTRYRPKVILADHKITADGARQRAIREERRAVARSERFVATVQGWFRENGALWDVNLLTRVIAPRVNVDRRDLLVYRHMNVLDNILTPLRIYDASALECILNRYKPAWQTFRYVYESSQPHG